MINNELMAELKDILNRIQAYHALHREGCFVFRFVGFKKFKEEELEEGDEYLQVIDETKSTGGIFGDIDTVRLMLNELRDYAEDAKDDEGFVNI